MKDLLRRISRSHYKNKKRLNFVVVRRVNSDAVTSGILDPGLLEGLNANCKKHIRFRLSIKAPVGYNESDRVFIFPLRRSVLLVYGGCGASEERGWRGDHVHPQL